MSDTPIVDAAAFQPDARLFVRVVLADKARDLERMCAELYARLNYTRDYVNEAVNKHLRMYGENYPSKNLQLAALKKELALVDAALAKWQAMQPNVDVSGAEPKA